MVSTELSLMEKIQFETIKVNKIPFFGWSGPKDIKLITSATY